MNPTLQPSHPSASSALSTLGARPPPLARRHGRRGACRQRADQAALHGLLGRIRDLNVTIVSVQRVGAVEADRNRPSPHDIHKSPEERGAK